MGSVYMSWTLFLSFLYITLSLSPADSDFVAKESGSDDDLEYDSDAPVSDTEGDKGGQETKVPHGGKGSGSDEDEEEEEEEVEEKPKAKKRGKPQAATKSNPPKRRKQVHKVHYYYYYYLIAKLIAIILIIFLAS